MFHSLFLILLLTKINQIYYLCGAFHPYENIFNCFWSSVFTGTVRKNSWAQRWLRDRGSDQEWLLGVCTNPHSYFDLQSLTFVSGFRWGSRSKFLMLQGYELHQYWKWRMIRKYNSIFSQAAFDHFPQTLVQFKFHFHGHLPKASFKISQTRICRKWTLNVLWNCLFLWPGKK